MASQGPLSPGTVSGDGGGVAWTDINNVKVEDAAFATASLDQQASDRVQATNFGFSIPAGSTINGIVVEVKKKSDQTGNVVDDQASLTKDGVNAIGSDYKDATQWPAVNGYTTYGTGTTDLWGTTWSVAEINASTFGVLFSANESGVGLDTAYIDHIRITVHYTEAAGGKARVVRHRTAARRFNQRF